MKSSYKLIAIAAATSLLASGCSVFEQKSAVQAMGAEFGAKNDQGIATMLPKQNAPVVKKIKGAWLAPKTKSLGEDANLPAEFTQPNGFGVGWKDRANLRTIAERVSKITGIPVRIMPDVFEKTTNAAGGTDTGMAPAAAARSSSNLPPVPLPPTPAALNGSPTFAVDANADDMEMNFSGSLQDFLNRVADHFSLNWAYKDGTIQFYRYVTRTFQVNANPGKVSFTSNLGKSSGGTSQGGSGGSGSSGGSSSTSASGAGSTFTSSGEVASNIDFDIWKTLQDELNVIKSPAGKIVINEATGTVTMRDTREAVDTAERLLKHQNALMTQQVAIRVEMYSITSNDSHNLGVNWNGVFQRLSNLAPQWGVSLASPTSLVAPGAGSLGVSILAPITGAESGLQQFTGSQALVQALQGEGQVHLTETAEAITLNRQPTPIASTNEQTYLASTSPGVSGSSGSSSALPGLTPGTVTTGFISYMLPTVLENNSVLLKFSLDSSILQSMGVVSTGSGETLQSIQTPDVSGNSGMYQVALKPGATLIMSGLARNSAQYSQNGLTDQVGLGGSYAGSREKDTIVILITAQLLPGA